MELTFLGNKYAKTEALSTRPTIQLKYMGKSYRAEQIKSVRNCVALTVASPTPKPKETLGQGTENAADVTA